MPNLTPSEASDRLNEQHGIKRKPVTLAKLRCLGGSPPYFKAGRSILYPQDDLDDWAKELLGDIQTSTSEAA